MKRDSITCSGTTHGTFYLTSKRNLLSPDLQHPTALAGTQGVMGTTGLCPPEVPWAYFFVSKTKVGKKTSTIKPRLNQKKKTETEDKQLPGQGGVLHSILSFDRPSLTTEGMLLLQAAGTPATKTKMETTEDFFSLTPTAWGNLTFEIGFVL